MLKPILNFIKSLFKKLPDKLRVELNEEYRDITLLSTSQQEDIAYNILTRQKSYKFIHGAEDNYFIYLLSKNNYLGYILDLHNQPKDPKHITYSPLVFDSCTVGVVCYVSEINFVKDIKVSIKFRYYNGNYFFLEGTYDYDITFSHYRNDTLCIAKKIRTKHTEDLYIDKFLSNCREYDCKNKLRW